MPTARGREILDWALPLGSFDPQLALEEFGDQARTLCARRRVSYFQYCFGNGFILADPHWIDRVLHNLLAHLLDTCNREATISVKSIIDASTWRVVMEQNPRGNVPQRKQQTSEQLFHLPRMGQGKVALALCKSIVTLHAGRIWAESSGALGGVRVVFAIPKCPR